MKLKCCTLALLALASLTAYATPSVEVYQIDNTHSSVKFSIRHFVAKSTGSFNQFSGSLTLNRDDLTQSSVEAQIQIPSVDTDNAKRDAHLKEDDYFDAAGYPVMTFKSTEWTQGASEAQFQVTGDLTLRGITRPVTLQVELLGFGEGRDGAYLTGWEATTTLDRTQWDINGGQPAVGTDVEVTINIEAIRQ